MFKNNGPGGCCCEPGYDTIVIGMCNGTMPEGAAFTITCGGTIVYSGTTSAGHALVPTGILATGCTLAVVGYAGPRWASPAPITLVSGMEWFAYFGPADGYECCGTCPFPISNRLLYSFTFDVLTSGTYVPTVFNVVLEWFDTFGGAGEPPFACYFYPGTDFPFIEIGLVCNFTILWQDFGEGDDVDPDVTVDCDPASANVWYLTWLQGEFEVPESATVTELTPVP